MEAKKRIIIDCEYEVYTKEWSELRVMIKNLLSGTKYSNLDCYIDTYYPDEE